ncbi:MAG: acyl-ACP--UDP-N-acetylglucosamine O-acyltransferase [Phycisphaeraceae bacterium]
MSNVHHTAVIESGAQIDPNAVVGPFCHVGRHVRIGKGTRLISNVTVMGRTTIGEHNIIWPQASLGGDPQDLKYTGEEVHLTIGDHNDIRENVTIHMGTGNGGGITRVGSDNLLMVSSHVAHDCIVGNHCILANAVTLAGHVTIEDHANVAGMAGIHHYCTVGQYAYVGGMTRVVKDVPPFCLYEGDPARERGINAIGLERHGFSPNTLLLLKEAFKRLFLRTDRVTHVPTSNRRKWYAFKTWFRTDPLPREAVDDEVMPINLSQRLELLAAEFPNEECIQILCQFLRNRSVGMSGRYRETLRRDDRRKKGFAALAAPEGDAKAGPADAGRKVESHNTTDVPDAPDAADGSSVVVNENGQLDAPARSRAYR